MDFGGLLEHGFRRKPNFRSTMKAMNEAPPSSRQALMICTHVVATMPPKAT